MNNNIDFEYKIYETIDDIRDILLLLSGDKLDEIPQNTINNVAGYLVNKIDYLESVFNEVMK